MGHPDLGQLRAEVKRRAVTGLSVLALAGLNAWILGRLFKTEYTPWMGSIEGAGL